MARVAGFILQAVYQMQPAPGVIHPLPVVQDLIQVLTHFQPHQYLLLKSHPAFEDAVGEASLFKILYGLYMSMKLRRSNLFHPIKTRINNSINSRDWVCRGVQNLFLHQLMRFSSSGPNTLKNTISKFLCNSVNCGGGRGEGALLVRRNGEAHLAQDYCGTMAVGTEEGLRAALAAVMIRRPALMITPYPQDYRLFLQLISDPFTTAEADAIASAITDALLMYRYSTYVAEEAAAAAAARFLAAEPIIHPYSRPFDFQNQQIAAIAEATAAAKIAAQTAQQMRLPAQPLLARNMFDLKDISNMFTLMEPGLICTLHREMFDAGELAKVEWHWSSRQIRL